MKEVSLNASSSEELSPEDINWVDSCLLKDADIPESDWDSLRDPLVDTINAQADMSHNYTVNGDSDQGGIGCEITFSEIGATADPFTLMDGDDHVSLHEATETSEDNKAGQDRNDAEQPSNFQVNPFRPTYSEDANDSQRIDSGVDLGSSSYEFDPISHDIFRVWELDISDEEDDDFVKQLNKALAESSLESTSTLDDSTELKGLKDLKGGSLDELIAGVADMSLSHD